MLPSVEISEGESVSFNLTGDNVCVKICIRFEDLFDTIFTHTHMIHTQTHTGVLARTNVH